MEIKYILAVAGILLYILLLTATYYLITGRESRAMGISLILAHTVPVPFFLMLLFSGIPVIAGWIFLAIIAIFVIVLMVPLKGKRYPEPSPARHMDERDTMFSRNEIKPGTYRYDQYYSMRPENLEKDLKFRSKPGLLDNNATYYNRFSFASAHASFEAVTAFFDMRTGPVEGQENGGDPNRETGIGKAGEEPGKKDVIKDVDKDVIKDVIKDVDKDIFIQHGDQPMGTPGDIKSEGSNDDPVLLTRFLVEWGKKLGAAGIGIVEMKPYHYYTIGGRRERYGIEIINNHNFGIVFTTEMDYELTSTGPQAGIVMESAHQYLNSGMIATQVALTLRKLGYDAKTHIDGNYDLICPLVARDAGMGEIGRMGLLMTPGKGPRVRISVVTTNAVLVPGKGEQDNSMIDFCTHCRKCAVVCPSASIPHGERENFPGGLRWKIDQEGCYTYWCQAGTDCGRCMAACPYSHPDNAFHRAVRWGISNNLLFRRLAIKMDDLFYGRKPTPLKMPGWI